jgi:hypothetical protein
MWETKVSLIACKSLVINDFHFSLFLLLYSIRFHLFLKRMSLRKGNYSFFVCVCMCVLILNDDLMTGTRVITPYRQRTEKQNITTSLPLNLIGKMFFPKDQLKKVRNVSSLLCLFDFCQSLGLLI